MRVLISALSVIGLFLGAEAFKFTTLTLPQIPGCPVDPSKYIGSTCENQINTLNSTVHAQPGTPPNLSLDMVEKLCSSCSKDLSSFGNALTQDSSPACQSAKLTGLYCQKNAAGNYCLNRFSDLQEFQSLTTELATGVTTNPNFALSADQCKRIDCCYYQEFEFVRQTMGSSPFNVYEKIMPLVDKCATPVQKTCEQSSTIILS
jgi:hypothetical protein